MRPSLSSQEFVAKWRKVERKERAAAQEHFLDLCALVGHPTPADDEPARFTPSDPGSGWVMHSPQLQEGDFEVQRLQSQARQRTAADLASGHRRRSSHDFECDSSI